MIANEEKNDKFGKLNTPSLSQTCLAQRLQTQLSDTPKQTSPETFPTSTAHLSAYVPSHVKCPPLSTNIKSSNCTTFTVKSFLPFSNTTLEKFKSNDQLLLQKQQQKKEYDNANSQREIDHNSDTNSSDVNEKTEGHRRFREFVLDVDKDDVYWEKRRKNNEAARRSREKRRMNDIVLAGRINILEQDNTKLRRELLVLKKKLNLTDGNVYEDRNNVYRKAPAPRLRDASSPQSVNHNKTPHQNRVLRTFCSPSAHLRYSSPPPLLAVADVMSMGVAVFSASSNPGLPYFLPDAVNFNQNGCLKTPTPSLSTGHHQHHDQRMPVPYLHHPMYLKDATQQKLVDEREDQIRERSKNSIESTQTFHLDPSMTSLLRRSSMGNYSPYRDQFCQPKPEVNSHPYCTSNSNQANHVYHIQRVYDNHSLIQNSSISSQSSDDYDEPLQLTVRRDNNVTEVNRSTVDDNERSSSSTTSPEERSAVSVSSPVSTFPLKLRHKLPSHEQSYPSSLFPTTAPVALAPPYPENPISLTKSAPTSLAKTATLSPFSNKVRDLTGCRKHSHNIRYRDPKYLERRRRNNEAARKCRENRKYLIMNKEAKSSCLETENNKLKVDVKSLQMEMKQLKDLIKTKQQVDENEGDRNKISS